MIRLIKRYESRKLYDTEESRYVSLDEIATWIRQGQEVKVVDNSTNNDVTSQTLTQVILDEGRKGTSFLPSELLHDLAWSVWASVRSIPVWNRYSKASTASSTAWVRCGGPARRCRACGHGWSGSKSSLAELERDDGRR